MMNRLWHDDDADPLERRVASGTISGSGRIAQLAERLFYKEDVGGSSPSSPTRPLSPLSQQHQQERRADQSGNHAYVHLLAAQGALCHKIGGSQACSSD